jgi:hypothetical protein
MNINRRFAVLITLTMGLNATLNMTRAEDTPDFDPIATAKLRAGEIAREITASARDVSIPEPSREDIFNMGLLLQAGLRALLPVQERQGVALPGTPSASDPQELVVAQENYKAVFESGAQATPAQKTTAVKSIELATQRLRSAGYTSLAARVDDWLQTQ